MKTQYINGKQEKNNEDYMAMSTGLYHSRKPSKVLVDKISNLNYKNNQIYAIHIDNRNRCDMPPSVIELCPYHPFFKGIFTPSHLRKETSWPITDKSTNKS